MAKKNQARPAPQAKAPNPPAQQNRPVTVNVPAGARAVGGGVTPATDTSSARRVTTGRGPGGRIVTTGRPVGPPRPTSPRPPVGGPPDIGEIPPLPPSREDDFSGETGGFDPMAAYYAEQDRLRSINLIATLRGVMETYGLTSLMSKIEQYVKDGYEADAVLALIRQTPEYDARFPAMKILAGKQRSISEAEYIAYERRAAELERAYGMPSGMLDKAAVTRLIGNEVSGQELEERLTLAASGAYQTAPQVRQQFQEYYGIGSGALTAYFLDPDKALPLLNKQFVSAQIGAEAAMQGIGVGVDVAQGLQEAGISQAEARQGFERVASMSGLTSGRGDVVTQRQLIEGNLLQSSQAQQEIERTASSRRGRFETGGRAVETERGVSGLGSAAT